MRLNRIVRSAIHSVDVDPGGSRCRDRWEVVVARSKNGEAISARRRTPAALKSLQHFVESAERRGDLNCWRRGRAVLGYIEGRRVVDLAAEAG